MAFLSRPISPSGRPSSTNHHNVPHSQTIFGDNNGHYYRGPPGAAPRTAGQSRAHHWSPSSGMLSPGPLNQGRARSYTSLRTLGKIQAEEAASSTHNLQPIAQSPISSPVSSSDEQSQTLFAFTNGNSTNTSPERPSPTRTRSFDDMTLSRRLEIRAYNVGPSALTTVPSQASPGVASSMSQSSEGSESEEEHNSLRSIAKTGFTVVMQVPSQTRPRTVEDNRDTVTAASGLLCGMTSNVNASQSVPSLIGSTESVSTSSSHNPRSHFSSCYPQKL